MTATPSDSDPTDIFMWLRIDEGLTTSGQPKERQLAELAALGVAEVVNLALHTHERALPDETASVRKLGMNYVHLPVQFDAPTEQDYKDFAAVMQSLAGRAIHVHCIANFRVSAFLYRYRRDLLGVPDHEARATMERIWRPGGVWASLIGDAMSEGLPHRFAGREYWPTLQGQLTTP